MSEDSRRPGLFRELLKRRVFQIVGVYLGVSFAAFEFTNIVVERYGWSDRLVDMTLALLLSMLPTVMMLAWFHGAPGKDRWTRVEKIGIPLNLAVAAALVAILTAGKPAGAVSEVRRATTADGEQFVLEVAPDNQVRRALIYFFDPTGLREGERWMAYGLPLLSARTADRSPFVDVLTLYDTDLFWRIERAGYADGLGAPVSLLQQTALDWYQDFFITGSLAAREGRLILDLEFYSVQPFRRVFEERITAEDVYGLAEAVSALVTEGLLEDSKGPGAVDYFPVQDALSPHPEALATFVAARNAHMIDHDLERSIALAQAAIEADAQFAQARLFLLQRYVNIADYEAALAQIPSLTRLNHRLTPEQRIQLKALTYELRRQPEQAIEVARTWVELEPENYQTHTMLANYLWNANLADEALVHYQRSLELMPNQEWWILGRVAEYHFVRGDLDRAEQVMEAAHQLRPNLYQPLVSLGDVYTRRGALEEAGNYYRKGNLAEPEMVTPLLRLAENAARRGDLPEAWSTLEEADLVAVATRQKAAVAEVRSRLSALTGRPVEALDYFEEQLGYLEEQGEQVDARIERLRYADLYIAAGRGPEIRAYIEGVAEQFRAPLDFIPSVGHMIVELLDGDLDASEAHCARVEQGLLDLNRPDLLHLTSFTQGAIEKRRGRLDAAAALFRQAHEQFRNSVQQTNDFGSTDGEEIVLALARTELARDRPAAALEALGDLRRSWPHHPEAALLAAEALVALGRDEQARSDLDRALAFWANAAPDYEPAREAAALAARLGGAPAASP